MVRIVNDFWENYHTYEDLVKRCFYYLLRRYPNPDGDKDAYSQLLTRLFDLRMFQKFSAKKLAAHKLGINKKWAHAVITPKEASEAALKELGVNVDSKFEQFVFKWVEHCLSEAYMHRRKHAERFIPKESVASEPPREASELRSRLNENQWAQSAEELATLQKHLKKQEIGVSCRAYPTFEDAGDYLGSKMENPQEVIEEQELQSKFTKSLNERERKVLEHRLDGLIPQRIAEAMHCSPQNVSTLLKSIQTKYLRYMAMEQAKK